MIVPRPLEAGDRIAIVSPSGIIAPERVYGAMQVIQDAGFEPVAMPHVFDRCGTMAGTDEARLADLAAALTDPAVRAVWCSRGGYGAVRLIESIDRLPLESDPKWLIGYSDITALHSVMARHGIVSLHAPMARHLAELGPDDPCTAETFAILRGNTPEDITYQSHPLSRPGRATGKLRGGNLAVISGLLSTPFDPVEPGSILVIEDIAEPIYKVERMLYTLRLSGALESLAGLVTGQFTAYEPSRDFSEMEEMIARITCDLDIPVAMGFPVGHVANNRPLPLESQATLTVTPCSTTLSFH